MIVYVAVHVLVASGAMSPAGQLTVVLSSVTVTGPVTVSVLELLRDDVRVVDDVADAV